MSTSIRGVQPARQTDSNWSRMLWKDCPWEDIGNTVEGVKHEDNFQSFPTSDVNSSNISEGYKTWVDSGGTILQSTTDAFGAALLTLDTTSNDAASIQTGNLVSFLDKAEGTQPYDIWFEAEFSIGTLTDSFFVGLMAYAAPATAGLISDSDILGGTGDVAFVGFGAVQAAPTLLTFTFKKNSQTVQVPITSIATMVADTKVRVGFHYLSINPTAKRITVFNDNVVEATGVTQDAIVLATFPDAIPLAMTAVVKNTTSTAGADMNLTRWRVAMRQN